MPLFSPTRIDFEFAAKYTGYPKSDLITRANEITPLDILRAALNLPDEYDNLPDSVNYPTKAFISIVKR